MSVSLALVPIVLILRVSMGKDNFNNWIESSEVKMPTSIKDDNELILTVKKAGYDAFKLGNLIKTHMNEKNEYFFWEKINGVWTAVFSKYDSQESVKSFIKNLELNVGKTVFNCDYDALIEKNQNGAGVANQEEIYPTNFVDEEILLDTLRDYGVQTNKNQNGEIQCKVENSILSFYKENSNNYVVKVKGDSSLKYVYDQLNVIDEEYKRNVQSYTYNKVVEKLQRSNMNIESEEVMEDNSLVLTINVN
jgi:hypothetical protein